MGFAPWGVLFAPTPYRLLCDAICKKTGDKRGTRHGVVVPRLPGAPETERGAQSVTRLGEPNGLRKNLGLD